jgi:hypothetical protein
MTPRKLTANKRPDGFFDLSQLSRGFQITGLESFIGASAIVDPERRQAHRTRRPFQHVSVISRGCGVWSG